MRNDRVSQNIRLQFHSPSLTVRFKSWNGDIAKGNKAERRVFKIVKKNEGNVHNTAIISMNGKCH